MRTTRATGTSRPRPVAALAAALIIVGGTTVPAAAAQEQPLPDQPQTVEQVSDAVGTEQGADPSEDGADQEQATPSPAQPPEPDTEPAEDGTEQQEAAPRPEESPEPNTDPGEDRTDQEQAAPGHEETPEPAADPGAQHAPVLVTVPQPRPTVVDGEPGYLLPPDDGAFSWFVNGIPVGELVAAGTARLVPAPDGELTGGWYELTSQRLGEAIDAVVIGAVAQSGHLLVADDGEPSAVRYVVDPRAALELHGPSPTDGDGRDDTFTVHDVVGQVVHDGAGATLGPGEHPVIAEYVDATATVELSVAAADGYRLEIGGTPVETTPGAGGTWTVVLTFTDVEAPEEVDDVAADNVAEPDDAIAADGERTPESAPGDDEGLTARLLTIGAAPAAPGTDAAEEQPAVGAEADAAVPPDAGRLSDSGPEGLDLMVLLSIVFLGGAWLLMGAGRDLFS